MNQRGQALVESLFFFVTLGGILASFVGCTKWFLIQQKLLMAARTGAVLYSSGHFERNEVKVRLRRYLTTGFPQLLGDYLTIRLGGSPDARARLFRLDEVSIVYQPFSPLVRMISPTMEEKCVTTHAPHYGPPWQPFFGPAVPWTPNAS